MVGFYDETAVYAADSSDKFFQRLSETSDSPGKPFYMPNGTPFFCTAGGILLKRGLSDWDRLPESERKPGAVTVRLPELDPSRIKTNHRLTKPPPDTLILRSYVRGLKLDKDGSLFAPKTIDWEYNIKLPAEPNQHDILTGSTREGRAWSYNLLDDLNLERGAMTCSNYTSNAEDQFVMVGHHDRAGTAPISPWNAAHPSVGCSQAKLVETGGAGLLYCFAID